MPVNSFDDYPMNWKPDLSRKEGPKYVALADMLEEDIQEGILKPGMKLPPQRELADYLDVNLSTISRAFKLCEQRGLICASVGNGTYISADASANTMLLLNEGMPHMIEMGAIIPDKKANEWVKTQLEQLLAEQGAVNLLSYGTTEGTPEQKRAGREWVGKTGFQTTEENIILAAGGQNALTATIGALFQTGDRIGVDPLTYPGMKSAAKLFGIQLIPIQTKNHEMTEEGIMYAVKNENIKGIYTIPDFHNPTARVMQESTRQMIARVTRELNLIVIEDGINGLLASSPQKPIASYAPEQTIYLSSVSKTICAGLRTAFIVTDGRYKQDIVNALYAMNISISPLLAQLTASIILSGKAEQILSERREEIQQRNRILREVLADYQVEGDLDSPLSFIKLPDYFTGKSFEICAKEMGIQVYGAERFAVGTAPCETAIRISITTPSSQDDLREGLYKLKTLLSEKEEQEGFSYLA